MISLAIALAIGVAEPDAAKPPSPCDRRLDCRRVEDLHVTTKDGTTMTFPVNDDVPFILEGRLFLLPGEMVGVKLEETGGRARVVVVGKWRAAGLPVVPAEGLFEEGPAPEGVEAFLEARKVEKDTLRLSFQQLPGKPDAVLVVENGYDRPIDYRAEMALLDGARRLTSVCEVLPGVPAYEHWPHPITALRLDAFRFLPAGDRREIACD